MALKERDENINISMVLTVYFCVYYPIRIVSSILCDIIWAYDESTVSFVSTR